MSGDEGHEPATQPEDLGRFFMQRANAGDLEGLMALYEPDAVLAVPGGAQVAGKDAIRQALQRFLDGTADDQRQEPARAAVREPGAHLNEVRGRRSPAEVARRQPDGTWLWVIDQPRVVG